MISRSNITLRYLLAAFLTGAPLQALAAQWSYEGKSGPEQWASLHESFSLCEHGAMQSPIELGTANTASDLKVNVYYTPGPAAVVNNGHTIQVDFTGKSYLVSSDRVYSLLQVHFHTPSEHRLAGKAYPLVAHFVHQSESGELAVLGVFFNEGRKNNSIQRVIDLAPVSKLDQRARMGGNAFDPEKLVPQESPTVFRYMGSLTTPPCTEGVNWHVAEKTMEASADQIKALTQLMGENARPLQSTNNRLVITPK